MFDRVTLGVRMEMKPGLIVKVVDTDRDYLGIEISASNHTFAGSIRTYGGLEELGRFANQIAGFPSNAHDERTYEFGRRGRSSAGGSGRLHFHCLDRLGHAAVDIDFKDDQRCSGVTAHLLLSFEIEAAAIDRFTDSLRDLELARSGEAMLLSTG